MTAALVLCAAAAAALIGLIGYSALIAAIFLTISRGRDW